MSLGLVASGMSLVVVTDDRRTDGQLIAVGLGRPVSNPPTPRSQPVRVKKGDAVLWSAGPDRRDDGGQHPLTPGGSVIGEDWIVVIPLVPRARDR
jgi:co-chaperonin GroES (HSP10)